MSKERERITVRGMSSATAERVNDGRFNFIPRQGQCIRCGGYNYAYSAFLTNDGKITVRWICRRCGHSDSLRKVSIVGAKMSEDARRECDKRLDMLLEKDKMAVDM